MPYLAEYRRPFQLRSNRPHFIRHHPCLCTPVCFRLITQLKIAFFAAPGRGRISSIVQEVFRRCREYRSPPRRDDESRVFLLNPSPSEDRRIQKIALLRGLGHSEVSRIVRYLAEVMGTIGRPQRL